MKEKEKSRVRSRAVSVGGLVAAALLTFGLLSSVALGAVKDHGQTSQRATTTATSYTVQQLSGVTRYQESDLNLLFAESWRSSYASTYSGGSAKYSLRTGAAVTINFSGTSLTWVARTGPDCGKAWVAQDKGTPVLVDLYSRSVRDQQVVYSTGTLASGSHTLRIESSGQKNALARSTNVYIDALDVAGRLTATALTTAVTTRRSVPTTTAAVAPTTSTTAGLPTTTTTTQAPVTTTTTVPPTTTTTLPPTTSTTLAPTTSTTLAPTTTTTQAPTTTTTTPPTLTGRAFYVDATAGSDANNGTSESTPWKTLGKVHAYSASPGFAAGDSILLKRGAIWRETLAGLHSSGSTGSPITFDAYGAGANPIIQGSVDLSATGAWTSRGGNIWRATGLTKDIGNLIFNDEGSIGYKKQTLGACTVQGDFYYDVAGGYVDLYSTSNPGSYYTHIEAAQRQEAMWFDGNHYITVRNLDFRYCAWHGMVLTSCDHVTVEYCNWRWIGGSSSIPGTEYTRDANGLMFWDANTDITIRNSTFSDIWETAVSYQTMSAAAAARIYIYGNTIMRTGRAGFDVWLYNSGATMDSFYFCNNVVYDAGGSLFAPQRQGQFFTHYVLYSEGGANTNCNVLNNIFHTTDTVYAYVKPGLALTGWDIDYNCYYQDGQLFDYRDVWYSFADWKTQTGKDAHSITSDPAFVSLGTDFRLQADSPCINAGTGTVIPGAGQNMGAY
jgi:hypothetical protein